MSFTRLARILTLRLVRLYKFDCYTNESLDPYEHIHDIDIIRTRHPCFDRIQCFEKKHGIRHFTNK